MNIIPCFAVLLIFQFPFACNDALELNASSQVTDSLHVQRRDQTAGSNIVFRSSDGGQTWLDISEGLPGQDEYGYVDNAFLADGNGLWLTTGKGIYSSNPNSPVPSWTRDILPKEHSSIAPGKAGIYAYNYWGGEIFQRTKGTGVWSPVFTSFQGKLVRCVYETSGGTIFIGTDAGFFKSTSNGKSWKKLPAGGWGKMVESNGVLLATSQRGILRSTDDGENWEVVISEGGVGIDVETIEGGFAAITYSTVSETRRIRTSYDGGKTWQAIDAGLQAQGFVDPIPRPYNANISGQGSSDSTWHPSATSDPATYITSIVEVGENFFCGHTGGIYKSSDKGKTWKLVLCAREGKMFKLSVSGNVIYAVQVENHC